MADTSRNQSGQQQHTCVAYGKEEKKAACKGMAYGELIFDNGQKRREDGPSGEVHKPEAPEKHEEEHIHSPIVYLFPRDFTIGYYMLIGLHHA